MLTSSLLALAVGVLPIRVAAPGLSSADVAPEVVGVALEHLAQQLGERGLQVQGASRVATALGPERAARLGHCVEPACLKELQEALQVDAVLSGRLSRGEGAMMTVSLQVHRTADARQVATFEGTVASNAELPELLTRAAQALAEQTWDGFTVPVDTHPGRSIAAGVTLAAAVALLATAGVMYWQSASANGTLADGEPSLSSKQAFELAARGRSQQTVAIVTTVAGAVAALACLGLVLSSATEPGSHIALVPTGNGVALTGAF